jgi:hypothetical protein
LHFTFYNLQFTYDILQDYVDTVTQALHDHHGSVAVVGFTAWFRAISQDEKQTALHFFANRLPQVQVVELEGAEEAMFEAAAVNYAADKTGIGRPHLQMAAGGGSINMVYEHEPFNIESGFRAGMTELMENGLAAVPGIEDSAVKNVGEFIAHDSHAAFSKPAVGTVIAISACYYAAKGVGIANGDVPVLASEIVRAFTERKEAVLRTVKEEYGQVTDKKIALEISNLILQSEVFSRLLHPNAKVYFRRDWIIDGVPFRTTWTAGFFIKHYLREECFKCYHPWDDLLVHPDLPSSQPELDPEGAQRPVTVDLVKSPPLLATRRAPKHTVRSMHMFKSKPFAMQSFKNFHSFNGVHWGGSSLHNDFDHDDDDD